MTRRSNCDGPGFGVLYFDKFVKSQKSSVFVIPANAGIQEIRVFMDPRFRAGDGFGDFLRDYHTLFGKIFKPLIIVSAS